MYQRYAQLREGKEENRFKFPVWRFAIQAALKIEYNAS
jgi:hypothetical protein